MKLSVIIPCYNAADTIVEQLKALAAQQWSEPWEVIVANNKSTDESMQIVKQYQDCIPNLRIVDASARQGQPYALNVGLHTAVGEAVTFCDADDVVGCDWVANMGEALSRYDFVACRWEIEKLNEPWVCKSRGNPQYDDLQQYKYPPYLPHGGGGTLGIKRALCERIGDFDESLPSLHDTDYCWRLQLAGTPLNFVPEAVAHIRYRHTLSGIYRQARSYGEYNVLLYKKYRPLGMPPLSPQDGLKGWKQVLRRSLRIRSKEDYARWVWAFGWRVGRLKGSLKYGVFAL